MTTLKSALEGTPVLAILRGLTEADADGIGAALVDAGVTAIEVPLNRPGALAAVSRLVASAPEHVVIGVGTLTDPTQLPGVVESGASFAVSPHLDLELIAQCDALGLDTVPGVMTASEAYAAYRAGRRTVKIFPFDGLSPSGVASLLSIVPGDLAMMAVGGVDGHNAAQILSSGITSVGVGSWLYRPGDAPVDVHRKAELLVAASSTRKART